MTVQHDSFVSRALAGQPLDHCLVIDAHGHLGDNPNVPLPDTSLETMVARLDVMGIDVMCVSSIPGIYGQARRGNDQVIEATRRYPGRFFGYMVTDTGYAGSIIPEMERCYAAGLRGIKIYSHSIHAGFTYDYVNFNRVYDFAEAHGLPILAHTFSQAELNQLEPQFARCPHVRFILGHTGSCGLEPYVRLAKNHHNVYLETCLSICPRGLFEALVAEGLSHKVLWGSDEVFMDASQQLGRIVFAQVPEADKRKILGANAARVLGLRHLLPNNHHPKPDAL